MKAMSLMLAVALAAPLFAAAATEPLRNPFWPIGYEGRRESIGAEARVTAASEAAAEAAKKAEAEAAAAKAAAEKDAAERAARDAKAKAEAEAAAAKAAADSAESWAAARRSMDVGSPLVLTSADGVRRSSVMINGKVYVDGDVVSVTYKGCRYTWKVVGLNDDAVLKLVRVRARRVEQPVLEKGRKK